MTSFVIFCCHGWRHSIFISFEKVYWRWWHSWLPLCHDRLEEASVSPFQHDFSDASIVGFWFHSIHVIRSCSCLEHLQFKTPVTKSSATITTFMAHNSENWTVLCCIRHGLTFLLPPAPPIRTLDIKLWRRLRMFLTLTLTFCKMDVSNFALFQFLMFHVMLHCMMVRSTERLLLDSRRVSVIQWCDYLHPVCPAICNCDFLQRKQWQSRLCTRIDIISVEE